MEDADNLDENFRIPRTSSLEASESLGFFDIFQVFLNLSIRESPIET